MKIKKTTISETEIEVNLPYFSKDLDTYYCVVSEDEIINVTWREYTHLKPSVYISVTSMVSNATSDRAKPITQKEFEDIYDKASDYLTNLYENMRDQMIDKNSITVDDVLNNLD